MPLMRIFRRFRFVASIDHMGNTIDQIVICSSIIGYAFPGAHSGRLSNFSVIIVGRWDTLARIQLFL